MIKRILRLSPLLLCLLSARATAAPAEVFAGQNRKWSYYRSPNFELYSCRSDAVSRDVLEKMELLQAVFLDAFKLPVRLPQPVTIFCFSAEKDFNAYVPPDKRGSSTWEGFCLSQADRTVITLAPTWTADTTGQVVYHEYIHCLFHMAEENPPAWFNEGAAELFSTVSADKKWVSFGAPIPGRIVTLRENKMMPFDQLFDIRYDAPGFRDDDWTGLFYAQSWAFLHYLEFGENKLPADRIGLFLAAASLPQSQDKPAEFRSATRDLLGADYPELQKQLDRYVRVGTFIGRKMPRPAIAPRESYTVRPAPPEEMTVRLAELSLRYTDSAYANLAIRNELSRKPDIRLDEVLGAMALQAGEVDVARERWLEAFDLGSTNVAVYRELGRLESNLVFNQFDLDYRLPADRAERLRTLLNKSLEAAPAQSAGYEMLAWVEATAQKPDIASVMRVQKHFNSLNDKPRTLLALAIVRMRLGRTKEALDVLDDMAKLHPNDWVLFCCELTRARLEDRPVDESRLPQSIGRRTNGVMLPPTTMVLKPPH